MKCKQHFLAALVSISGVAVIANGRQALTIVDNIPGEFMDISPDGTGKGIPLNLGDDDSVVIPTRSVGNDVYPIGRDRRVVVANNGGVGFNVPNLFLFPFNQQIPSEDAFGGGTSALVFWDDIDAKEGNVYWQDVGETLIVQWHKRDFGDRDTAIFQLQIFGITDAGPFDVYAQFIYKDIEQTRPGGGVSATIGHQDGPGQFNDFEWSFNTAGAVSDNTVLSVIPEPATGVLLALVSLGLIRRR